jgi:cell division control protein 11
MSHLTRPELDEEGTRISLTIVDTPGFGDQIDNEARYAPLPPWLTALTR